MPWWLPASFALSLILLLVGGALLALGLTAGGLDLFDNLGQPYLWRVVWFTLWQAALSTFLSVGLAVPLARALARRQFLGRGLMLRLFSLSLVIPVIVAIFGIVAVHGRRGWVNDGLELLGFSGTHYLYGLGGILIGHTFFNMPFVARVLLQALEGVPPESWRVASQYGLRSRDVFRLIEWPALRTVLPGVAGLVFMLCFTSFAVVLTLGGGPKATTLEVAVYQALRFDFDLGRAVTLALVQLIFCGGIVLALLRLSLPGSLNLTEGRVYERPDRAGWTGRLWDGAVIVFAMLLVLLPLAAVALAGFNPTAASVLAEPRVWRAVWQSLVIALSSASLALLLGGALLISSRILRHRLLRFRAAARLELSASLILVVPPFVLATGLFVLLRPFADVFALGLPLVILVNALMALPFVVRFLGGPMMEEAQKHDRLCQSLGIAGWTRLRLIEWPNLRRPVALALAVAATLSLGDLGVIALFGSQDFATLPLLLYRAMGGFRMAEAAVIAALLSLLCLLLFLAIEFGLGRLCFHARQRRVGHA
ncbi:thiamine/thiamine pyrophosphate ABC transporter, permease protein [Pelagibius litoralis]|uniref:Thiamine transport system permease protein ThiP n=1 Tax=Pelagibius litoralis TaxID=374515 RepID=A0A967EV14_9PROT|nr:thiamine/thiamine pyrophosphate ABC transporter permease [Pelagibius litoralis]NIA67159.1 thiamine/thiamine pyrophosphate ABC transporter, permease protein [Pelagibius litoralis]